MKSRSCFWAGVVLGVVIGVSSTTGVARAQPTEPGDAEADDEIHDVHVGTPSRGWSVELTGAGVGLVTGEFEGRETSITGSFFGARWLGNLERPRFGLNAELSVSEILTRTPTRMRCGNGFQTCPVTQTDNVVGSTFRPEARAYAALARPVFAFVSADLGMGLHTVRRADAFYPIDRNDVLRGDQFIAGVGAGRIRTIDPVVRLRRLELALQAEGVLRGPIPTDVGTDVIRSWHAARDLRGSSALAATMGRLSDAGLVRGDLDVATTARALAILADPYVVHRRVGWEMRFGAGWGRSLGLDGEAPGATVLVARGQSEQPLSTTGQLSVRFAASYETGAEDSSPDPSHRRWSARGFLQYSRVLYGSNHRATGIVSLSAEAGASGLRPSVSGEGMALSAKADMVLNGTFSLPLRRGAVLAATAGTYWVNDGEYGIAVSVGVAWNVASNYVAPYVVPPGM